MGELVTIGSADALGDGELAAFEVGSRRIAVARTAETYYAFDDTCTHAACSLADGDLEDGTVVCPCHYGVYDLATGDVVDGPPPFPIDVYPVRVTEGDLQVEL
jgi:3-phenylpropionate/trans-cinnamate dioxygenase ferredoxin subunit